MACLSLLWFRRDHFLWCPSTNESVVLPNPEFPPHFSCTYGIGYDSTSDDYKILKIDNKGDDVKSYCKILALKSGSRRKNDTFAIVCEVRTHWHLFKAHFIGSV